MTLLQWAFVIVAGVAGYVGVSWLIERSRKTGKARAEPQAETHATAETPKAPATPATPAAPPSQASGERSAWDEFNKR